MENRETAISVRKIITNVKKVWKICVAILCTVFIIAVCLFIFMDKSDNSQVKQEEEDKYYKSVTYTYVDWNDFPDVDKNSGIAMDQFAQYSVNNYLYSLHTSILNENKAFFANEEDMQEIVMELKNKGYNSLDDNDNMGMSVVSNRCFTVTTTGKGDKEKTQFLATVLTQKMIEQIQEQVSDAHFTVQKSETFEVVKSGINFVRAYGDAADSQSEESVSSGVVKAIGVILIGIILDLILIAVFVVKDKNIYNGDEVCAITGLEYLAEIEKDEKEIIVALIESRAKVESAKKIAIVSATRLEENVRDILDSISNDLNKSGVVQSGIVSNIINEAQEIKTLSEYEKVIVLVQKENNDINDLRELKKIINVVGVQSFGFILA